MRETQAADFLLISSRMKDQETGKDEGGQNEEKEEQKIRLQC